VNTRAQLKTEPAGRRTRPDSMCMVSDTHAYCTSRHVLFFPDSKKPSIVRIHPCFSDRFSGRK
jgi:hypothetical protein